MTSIVLYVGACAALALLVIEHLVLMWRGFRAGNNWLLALFVPAVPAWQRGDFFGATRYGVWVVAYVTLAITARSLAMR